MSSIIDFGQGQAHARGAAELFAGPGEMRALCRELDWSRTPLGPVEGWSHSLRTTAGIVLGSRNPMFLFDPGPQLGDIVDAVNGVGASPGDLVAILEALKQAGALKAELIIL